MDYIMLAGGLALLVFAGDILVRGAVGLSERFHIPPLIIGLTVVSFGTSAPELMVSLKATLDGYSGIAVGNVVGSNIANVLLVLGMPAMIASIDVNQPYIRRNLLFMLGASIIFIALCFGGPLAVPHGVVLITLLGLFLYESMRRARAAQAMMAINTADLETIDGVEGVPHSFPLSILFIVLGIIGLPIAAHLTVEGASGIAKAWGVSDHVIGLTVVAIGTSLPELAATIMAALRSEAGLAIGNVIGSNLFNLLAILGITALVAPVAVPDVFLDFDLWVMLGASALLAPFIFSHRRIGRAAGIAFVLLYATYIVILLEPAVVGMADAR